MRIRRSVRSALRSTLAALVAAAALAPAPALAGSGGPDAYGYTWEDINSGCSIVAGDEDVLANSSNFSPAFFVGPIPLGFNFPFYDQVVTQVWLNQSGVVHFALPPSRTLWINQGIPTAGDGLAGFVAPYWGFVLGGAPAVQWESFPARGYFKAIYDQEPADASGPIRYEIYLYQNGDIRIEYLVPSDGFTFTIGMESLDETTGLELYHNGVASGGLTYGTPTPFAVCFERPTALACPGPPLTCGTPVMGTSPVSVPTNVTQYGCGAGTWNGREATYVLDVAALSDVQVTLSNLGGRNMAAWLLRSCDEWDCVAGGTGAFNALSVAPGRYYVVVDGVAAADNGSFTLTAACTQVASPIACGDTIASTTAAQPNRLQGYACGPAGDWTGGERYYEIDFMPPGNLNVSISGAPALGAFIFDASQPLTADRCLTGGVGGAVLYGPAAGRYVIVVDGPAAAAGPFTVGLSCAPELSCTPTAGDIGCQQRVTGSTVGGINYADFYACALGVQYPGPEDVYAFTNPMQQVVSFVLDAADPRLDLILVGTCNEGDCIEIGDADLSLDLAPGSYYLVVDGREGASGAYTLSGICGFGLEPAVVSVTGAEGECFDEHKVGWLTPELVKADVLLAIDLTGTMQQERAQLDLNMQRIIDELAAFIPDLAFGLASQVDYPLTLTTPAPCAYSGGYGAVGEWPYRLHQAITTDRTTIRNAVRSLPVTQVGGDLPESHSRVLFEAANDTLVGWRPGSRRILVYFTDELPHDCNVLECLGRTATSRGADPGRDNRVGTADDIRALDAVQDLIDEGIVLLPLESSQDFSSMGVDTFNVWDCWAQRTGGRAERLLQDGTVPAGINLATLIADLIRAQGAFCPTLELRAQAGFESWLADAGVTYTNTALPALVDFDIRICVPAGTPAGVYSFTVELWCGSSLVSTQQVTVDVVDDCAPAVVSSPQDTTICLGETTTLDASGMGVVNCGGTTVYEWRDGAGNLVGSTATVDVTPDLPTDYTVTVSCSADPTCATSATLHVDVHLPPQLDRGQVRDLADCSPGLELSWDAATFRDPTGTGVYNIYRSETSCADAVTRPPVQRGYTSLLWVDGNTRDEGTYYYVVQAEDARTSTACTPDGPNNGGSVNPYQVCLGPILDVSQPGLPDELGWGLRVSKAGDQAILEWSLGRALLPTEHYHVLKGLDRFSSFPLVSPEGLTATTWSEVDTVHRLQFFDVRIANACEEQSADEEPQGWDGHRPGRQ